MGDWAMAQPHFQRSRHSSPAEALAKEGWATCGSNLQTPGRPFTQYCEAGRGNGAYRHPDPARFIEGRALPVRRLLGYRFPGGTPRTRSGLHPLSRISWGQPQPSCGAKARSIRHSSFPQSTLNGVEPAMPARKRRASKWAHLMLSGTLSLTR